MDYSNKSKEELVEELVRLHEKNNELLFTSIVENLPYMVFAKDAKTLDFTLLNKAGEKLLGHTQGDLVGKNDYDFFPKEEADDFTRIDRQVLASKKRLDIPEEPIQTTQGTRYLHTSKIPILDSKGEVKFLLGISIDITEKKILEEKIKSYTKELETQKHHLEELSNKLAKYLSPQIYHSIFSGETSAEIETYKRPLTVFFSDIVGFTKKTEQTEINKLTQWLNIYLDKMATLALRYDGTLDKFIGDAVMIFFGAPQTSGDKIDAIKCLLMAMEMQIHAKRLGVDIRVGVNSGECVVGNFGSEQHIEYSIIGADVNLAARLESHANPGHILISEYTYQLVKEVIHCEQFEMIQIKGMEREVMGYIALDIKETYPENYQQLDTLINKLRSKKNRSKF